MFFLSCGALSRPFSLVFVKTLPKEERPSRKRKKEEYNKKRRERSGEIVKGRSSIYRKILRYYSTVHLQYTMIGKRRKKIEKSTSSLHVAKKKKKS
jgi:hypothetical protein